MFNINRPNRNGVLAGALALMASAPFFVALAAEPVAIEDISQTVPYRPPVEDGRASDGGGSARGVGEGIELQYRLQILQQEVMEARGAMEELKFQLDQMRATQDARYLELDRRLQQLMADSPGARPEAAPATPPPPAADDGGLDEQAMDEQALYDTAQQLIRDRQYDFAIARLESLIERFPDGNYAANAYYWMGEVYMAKPAPDYERARQALAQVISFFPSHRKVPDAAFKLGVAYYLLGDCERATEILNQVQVQHAGKAVANLAEKYLQDTVRCDN